MGKKPIVLLNVEYIKSILKEHNFEASEGFFEALEEKVTNLIADAFGHAFYRAHYTGHKILEMPDA